MSRGKLLELLILIGQLFPFDAVEFFDFHLFFRSARPVISVGTCEDGGGELMRLKKWFVCSFDAVHSVDYKQM
jgi:hypothetical protein